MVPFQYLSLIWAMGFGFALWGDVPTIGLIFGSVIVVGSGLFLLWHESRPKMPKMGPPAAMPPRSMRACASPRLSHTTSTWTPAAGSS